MKNLGYLTQNLGKKQPESFGFMHNYTNDYLLNKQVKIFQPVNGYRASTDAVLLSSMISQVRKGQRILDVGSGTGAISLCLAERFKECGIDIRGVEIQAHLAELSNLSAQANGFDFLQYLNADIRSSTAGILDNCSFQHVITNPPYAEQDLPSPNESKATAHNLNGFCLREWINFCIKMTAPQGYFYIINRAEAVDEIITALHGKMGRIRIIPLFSKENQNAKRVIVTAQKDSKAPAVIHRGLIIHDANGNYTAQAEQILRDGKAFDEIF